MRSINAQLTLLAVVVWTASAASGAPEAAAQRDSYGVSARSGAPASTAPDRQRQVVNQYCAGCHNERNSTAAASGVILDGADLGRVAESAELWERVIRRVRAGAMPPAGMPRPDPATRD